MGRFGVRGLVLMGMWLAIPSEARHDLFARQSSTCPESTYQKCQNTKLPSNFCCPSGSTCIELAGSTTLLCCPPGANCAAIQGISCDIQDQNATLHPTNLLKTSALGNAMDTCGDKCCPFGFHCNNTICSIDTNQDAKPTKLPSSTSSTTISPASSTTSTSSSDNTTATSETCSKFPGAAILAGFFPGLALGILLAVAGICLLGAHRRKGARRKSGSSFGNTISEPQPSSTNDMRTDFLRKPPGTPSTTSSRSRSQRVRSLFRKSQNTNTASSRASSQGMSERSPRGGQGPVLAPPLPLVVQRNGSGQKKPERPVTPRLQREPSYEDINIFTDGDTASALRQHTPPVGMKQPRVDTHGRMSSQTTFTDMMESSGLAGLQKGQPYVYKGGHSPGYSPPRGGAGPSRS